MDIALTHGGDIYGHIRRRGCMPLDFSANCNPLGLPEGVKAAAIEALNNAAAYPDPLCRALRDAIAEHEKLPASWLLCGNGAADIIWRLVPAAGLKAVMVTAPSFTEYETAVLTSGGLVERHFLLPEHDFTLIEDILPRLNPGLDALFLCNPNNPTGQIIDPALLKKILESCAEKNILLILDECFNGFLPQPELHSLKPLLREYPNLLILRAFTKLYGMAGLRLGYCMCSDEKLLHRLRLCGQPWSVSNVAQAAGIAALKEKEYLSSSLALIARERAFLKAELQNAGLHVYGGEANYIFFYSSIPELDGKLFQRDILVRSCRNYAGLGEGYYRIAVRTHEDNERLISALYECI